VSELELSELAQQWVNLLLIWVGFGALVGLLARALLPGQEPRGTMGTILIGVMGSVLGPFVLSFYLGHPNFNPISPLGFLAAIGGAFTLLVAYRVALACWVIKHEEDAG
jgi:uncharacterized membrane protein YeaQ/YmgE (transglycosylase-associated protein family)